MTVKPSEPFGDEDYLAAGNGGDLAVLTPPLADQESSSELDLAEAVLAASTDAQIHSGPVCEHCEAPLATGQTFCRRCGFYPTLKTFVEVDAAVDETTAEPVQPARSHLEVWKSLVPGWGWALLAGVLVLLGISVAARLVVPAGTARAIWTYAQFAAGMAAFIGAHIACYMFAIMQDSTLNVLDIVLKPFAIWMITLRELPRSFKRVALGCWAQTAMLFAAFVVGGVRYDEIIDWGKVPPKKKPQPNVVAPINVPEEEQSMEEAMDEFTKNAGVTADEKNSVPPDLGNRRKMSRCLVIGFTPGRETDFISLLLAIDEGGGRWRYAGAVKEGIAIEARSILNQRMRRLLRSKPVVPCNAHAFWIEPKLMCTVWYEDWTETREFKRPLFDKLQADFEPAKKSQSP